MQNDSKRMLKRSSLMAVFLLFAFLFLTGRIFAIQIFDFERYQKKVLEQLTTESPVRADRGRILDASGRVLAENRTVYRISLFPNVVSRDKRCEVLKEKIAKGLCNCVPQLSEETVLEHLSHTSDLERTLIRETDTETAGKIINLIQSEGLHDMIAVEAISDRYYPYGTLAAHAIGFTGSDGQGLYGLELQYDEQLAGKSGSYVTARDSMGNALPNRYSAYVPAENGYDLHTTLDAYVQSVLEEQLNTARIESQAKNRVCGIVMNVKTGAILGMATSPSFDLNDPFTLNEASLELLNALGLSPESEEYRAEKNRLLLETWSNKAITEIYMPGSTFKTLTCSMVLEEKAVTNLSERFFCSGALTVADRLIHCHKAGGHGSLTFTEGLQKSCNPVMMTISARIGCDCFYNYVSRFGLLQKTGIDLPGEGNSIFHAPSNFKELDLATASFGQNFKVSVLQMITAVSSVANGGSLMTPYLVSDITDSNGNTVYSHEIVAKRQVISKETAKTISEILEGGVSGEGGARNAYVAGYRVAAKTGTSEKIGDNREARIGSCVGYAPADDPQYAVIVVVDEPTDGIRYGSVVAAPFVSNVFDAILPYLEVQPVYTEEEEKQLSITVPSCVGWSAEKAAAYLDQAGIAYSFTGEGTTVTAQLPAAGSSVMKNGAVLSLSLGEAAFTESTVPNLVGLGITDANRLLSECGFNLCVSGSRNLTGGKQTVKSQSPAAGTAASPGTVITLYFPYDESEE